MKIPEEMNIEFARLIHKWERELDCVLDVKIGMPTGQGLQVKEYDFDGQDFVTVEVARNE